jgi:hypothetical protein
MTLGEFRVVDAFEMGLISLRTGFVFGSGAFFSNADFLATLLMDFVGVGVVRTGGFFDFIGVICDAVLDALPFADRDFIGPVGGVVVLFGVVFGFDGLIDVRNNFSIAKLGRSNWTRLPVGLS